MGDTVGVVAALRRFPVKSMQGEHPETVVVGPRGVLGDRALAVVDRDTGEVVVGKTPDLGPRLLRCRASFTSEPVVDRVLPAVAIETPDGRRVRSDSGDVDAALSAYLGRSVGLMAAPRRDSELVTRRRDFLERVELGEHFENHSLLDALPVSLLTTSGLDRLGAARPETRFDERRFRMNVVVATTSPGFVENAWTGRQLRLGVATRLEVALTTPRCVLTTMQLEDLPRDPAVLRTVARVNSLDIAGRRYPCAGVYATVEAGGGVHIGDAVSLA